MNGVNALTVEAVGRGEWGTRVAVQISRGTFSGFRLDVFYWKAEPASLYNPYKETRIQPRPAGVESFDNVSIDEASRTISKKPLMGFQTL